MFVSSVFCCLSFFNIGPVLIVNLNSAGPVLIVNLNNAGPVFIVNLNNVGPVLIVNLNNAVFSQAMLEETLTKNLHLQKDLEHMSQV